MPRKSKDPRINVFHVRLTPAERRQVDAVAKRGFTIR